MSHQEQSDCRRAEDIERKVLNALRADQKQHDSHWVDELSAELDRTEDPESSSQYDYYHGIFDWLCKTTDPADVDRACGFLSAMTKVLLTKARHYPTWFKKHQVVSVMAEEFKLSMTSLGDTIQSKTSDSNQEDEEMAAEESQADDAELTEADGEDWKSGPVLLDPSEFTADVLAQDLKIQETTEGSDND